MGEVDDIIAELEGILAKPDSEHLVPRTWTEAMLRTLVASRDSVARLQAALAPETHRNRPQSDEQVFEGSRDVRAAEGFLTRLLERQRRDGFQGEPTTTGPAGAGCEGESDG